MSSLFFSPRSIFGDRSKRLLRIAFGRKPRQEAATDFDVSLFLQRLSHAAKLRHAKRVLWVNNIQPWADWRPRWLDTQEK